MTPAITSAPSLLSLLAVALYCLVVAGCALAAVTAARQRQQSWHGRVWMLLALLFAGLALLRFYGVEEALRTDLRMLLHAEGAYGQRRSFQRPVAAALIALIALGAFTWVFRSSGRVGGRRNIAVMVASASAFAMIGLLLVRLVSLSPIDALLYGPIKLNWIIDLGCTAGVLASAAYYVWLVRPRAP